MFTVWVDFPCSKFPAKRRYRHKALKHMRKHWTRRVIECAKEAMRHGTAEYIYRTGTRTRFRIRYTAPKGVVAC